jgi:hypothetical protein
MILGASQLTDAPAPCPFLPMSRLGAPWLAVARKVTLPKNQVELFGDDGRYKAAWEFLARLNTTPIIPTLS